MYFPSFTRLCLISDSLPTPHNVIQRQKGGLNAKFQWDMNGFSWLLMKPEGGPVWAQDVDYIEQNSYAIIEVSYE